MSSQHTPGPWVASQWPEGKINGLPAGGTAIHADWHNAMGFAPLVATLQPVWSNDACKANASLIAAAPELLDFAEIVARSACLQQVNQGRCICFACEAQRLISKAKGQ